MKYVLRKNQVDTIIVGRQKRVHEAMCEKRKILIFGMLDSIANRASFLA